MGESDTPSLVFLFEEDLPMWETFLPDGYIHVPSIHSGYSKIISFLGVDQLNFESINYIAFASAAKYIAEVLRFKEGCYTEEDKRKPRQEIVFHGNIVIYQGSIDTCSCLDETEGLKGFKLVNNSEIWLGRNPSEPLLETGGLSKLIFGNAKSKSEKEEVIRRVSGGYISQEDEERRRASKARSEDYRKGEADHAEQAFGAFGRGFSF